MEKKNAENGKEYNFSTLIGCDNRKKLKTEGGKMLVVIAAISKESCFTRC
jgi:hypothetical protein